jgi:hypothetical protein
MIKFCVNAGAQYGTIVVTPAAGNFSDMSPKVLLKQVFGLGTSYQFIRSAQTVAERRVRIAILAAFLSTSGALVVATDPAKYSRR